MAQQHAPNTLTDFNVQNRAPGNQFLIGGMVVTRRELSEHAYVIRAGLGPMDIAPMTVYYGRPVSNVINRIK